MGGSVVKDDGQDGRKLISRQDLTALEQIRPWDRLCGNAMSSGVTTEETTVHAEPVRGGMK